VTDLERVSRAVSLIDRLPSAQPGVSSCPEDTGPYVTLKFLSRGGADLATRGHRRQRLPRRQPLDSRPPAARNFHGNAALIKTALDRASGLEL